MEKGKPRKKGQNTIEFLLTYGWAIIVIAIMLALLFQIGVFNQNTFAPKLPPGACQVVRSGIGSASVVSLEGECTSIEPEYVATFGPSTQYQVVVNKEYFQDQSFTILGWMYWPSNVVGTNYDEDIGYAWSGTAQVDQGFGIFVRTNPAYSIIPQCESGGETCWYLNFYTDDLECPDGPAAGQWYQFGASWNKTTKQQTIWVNGAANCTGTSAGNLETNSILYIGSGQGTWNTGAYMAGWLSNVQLYNTSLSAGNVKALYLEGIGGVPIELNNLVLWLPLNGNDNDYSGFNTNDTAYNIGGSGVWSTKYTPP